jgi:hypothetical protein
MNRMKLVLACCLAASAWPAFADGTAAPRALSAYAHYELHDITADVQVHPKVMAKLTTELKLRLDEAVARWNHEGEAPGHDGTLAVEVVITDMKFVSGGKRVWAGGFAGNSHSSATVKLIDGGSGKLIDSRVFMRQADAVAGAWSFGAADNSMLDHLAADVSGWVIAQHDASPMPAATEPAPTATTADAAPGGN